MDSTLSQFTIEAGDAQLSGAPWWARMRWQLRRWTLLAAQNAPSRRRQRVMQLAWPRVAALVLAASLLGAGCGVLWSWRQQAHTAGLAAEEALTLVESRLDDIEGDLLFLSNLEMPAADADACPPALQQALLRASLASAPVQRFMWGRAGGEAMCTPEGLAPAVELNVVPGRALTLSSTGQIATRLMVSRAHPGGGVLAAALEPHALEREASAVTQGLANTSHLGLTLLSGNGQVLVGLSAWKADGGAEPRLRHMTHSKKHGVAVVADVPQHSAWYTSAWQALAAAAASAGVAGVVVAWVWRRRLLRSRLVHRIAIAQRKRQFDPWVQPIVDLATGRCTGAEVLMRWNHPHRGVLPPSEFIDEAERTGLIIGMSEQVMARAAHRLTQLVHTYPDLYFSFNVTPGQLRQPNFGHTLASLFSNDTLCRKQVLLELTERDAVDASVSRTLSHLRKEGWRIALDDFGTGQSSLAWLEQLGVDRIKIDRAFVRTIDEQTVKRPVLDAIIELGKQLGVPLIAEGVETPSQRDYLNQRGVQYAQGYWYAKPMTIDAFVSWMEGHGAAQPEQVVHGVVDPNSHTLWEQMRSEGGLEVRDRNYRLRTYRRCFVGSEAVDWLVHHQRVSREEAVRLGQRLVALGLVSHVLDEHDFADAPLFYRLALPSDTEAAAAPVDTKLRQALNGMSGPAMVDHARGLVRHKRCATGSSIVSWIAKQYELPRETATQWAEQVMRQGGLRHVFDDRPFSDDEALFRVA